MYLYFFQVTTLVFALIGFQSSSTSQVGSITSSVISCSSYISLIYLYSDAKLSPKVFLRTLSQAQLYSKVVVLLP
jgi:hypothetical protein